MVISHNVPALMTHLNMQKSHRGIAASMQKLSSGLRINSARDDATGMAISNKLSYQIAGLERAGENATHGISLIQTAEGALAETQNMIQRMRELAVQAANEVNELEDRQKIQLEIDQLTQEIHAISSRTEFNKIKILNGEGARITANTTGVTSNTVMLYISDVVQAGTVEYDRTTGTAAFIDTNGISYPLPTISTDDVHEIDNEGNNIRLLGEHVTIKGIKGEHIRLFVPDDEPNTTLTFEVREYGPIKIQTGPSYNNNVAMHIPKMSADTLGFIVFYNGEMYNNLNFRTTQGASDAIDKMDEALEMVSHVRARLGAFQNRLESTVIGLDVAIENTQSSRSRILDTDMAKEMTRYSQLNVMYQAGLAILGQANMRPQQVLSLLQ